MKKIGVFLTLMISLLVIAFVACDNGSTSDNNINLEASIGPTFVPANPDKGFNYGYYYYVPQSIQNKSKKYLLVESNNTGVSDDIAVHNAAVHSFINGYTPLADELGVVFLVPVFPRYADFVSHALCRQTLSINTGNPARIDLQLIHMMEDVREKCKSLNINLEPKVLMTGFSTSAQFANRFTAIHPHLVQAVVAGGTPTPILPIAEYNGERLIYPVGIADLQEIAGNPFNLQQYIKVPQFIYRGSDDPLDPLPFPDSYGIEERRIMTEVLGWKPYQDQNGRLEKASQIYEEQGSPARFVIYQGVGHNITNEISRHIIEFLIINMR